MYYLLSGLDYISEVNDLNQCTQIDMHQTAVICHACINHTSSMSYCGVYSVEESIPISVQHMAHRIFNTDKQRSSFIEKQQLNIFVHSYCIILHTQCSITTQH